MNQDSEKSSPRAASGCRVLHQSHHHLRSHVHLTNNIHLRNLVHMHRHRILMEARNSSELPLMKELTILRRTRSLRDPSTSPAWSSASHGSRKFKDAGVVVREEARNGKLAGSDSRRELRRVHNRDSDSTPKREKVDLRGGSHHWVADCFGDEVSEGAFDQKENNVAKNEMRDAYLNHGVEQQQQGGDSKAKGKKSRRLAKSRSYPRFGIAAPDANDASKSQRRPKGPSEQQQQHDEEEDEEEEGGEKEMTSEGPILAGRMVSEGRLERSVVEDERLQRGSIRRPESGWDETERRAEIARRVIFETSTGQAREGSQLSSPSFGSKALDHPHHLHHDQAISGLDLGGHESEGDEYIDSDEEEISLRHGLKQQSLPPSHLSSLGSSLLSSHAQSPLLYRDSMTNSDRSTRGGRRKSNNKASTSRDVSRYREGINLRVTGSSHGRLRGRRSSLRPALAADSAAVFGMEGELEVSELPRNGCGIPWYWTRMHKYKGRRFLDLAGRSLACGFAESSKRKVGKQDGQPGSNSRRDLILVDSRITGDRFGFAERSSDFENQSIGEAGDSPCSRADGKLLTAERSGELTFGSTREELSGTLMPSSPAYGDEVLGHLHNQKSEEPRSLSQKYRPRSFSELVGQSLVVKSLSSAVLKGKIAPVYLFQGPRGTGKTSAARIFAHALNCVSDSPDINRPCGFCKECAHPSPDIRELDAGSNNGIESVKALLGSMLATPSTSRCKVFIIDGCHLLSAEAWNAFLKALEEPPWHVVFVLITTEPEKIPRNAVSRCQKFLFSKIREVDIVNRLEILVRMENLEVEESALALVAAQAHGSLRDAETILDQLSLLGKQVTPSMVQEMVGLVSNDRLIDLLDLALSADAVNTVRCMRELLSGGVEPLALVSQLATLITDILAGSYEVSRDKQMKGFFFRRTGRKEESVRLRQALRILSEAEKQLRTSSDQPTWLTAALLQFAPDRSYQASSVETSVLASPVAQLNDTSEKETVGESVQPWTSEEQIHYNPDKDREGLSRLQMALSSTFPEGRSRKSAISSYVEAKIYPAESPLGIGLGSPGEKRSGRPSNARSDEPLLPGSIDDLNQKDYTVMSQRKLEEVWQRVLQGSRSNVLKQLLQGQGKLLSLLVAEAFAVAHLEFRHPEHKARAERSRSRICNAFQMALGCPVELQITLACMPGEQENGRMPHNFTNYQDQAHLFETWPKEKVKSKASTPDGRPHRRRQRSSRNQRSGDSVDISQSLYNAVMGDSKGFKPEILPVVSSSKWGRQGVQPATRPEEEASQSAHFRDGKRFSGPTAHDFQQQYENQRTRYAPGILSRTTSGKIQLRTAIHQFDDSVGSPSNALQTDLNCGSSRKKSVKFKDVSTGVGLSATHEQESQNVRLESVRKPAQVESRLCWRVQKLDEEKIRIQRRRRQRRVRFLLRLVPCAKSNPTHQNRT